MRRVLSFLVVAGLFAIAPAGYAVAGNVTAGTADTGNCYPFMCNDSGANTGSSIEYQQVYSATAFGSSPLNITSETFFWNFAQQYGGSDTLLGGTYVGYLSTTGASVNGLNSNCLSCNAGADAMQVFDFTIPSGGTSFGASYTFNNLASFLYNPNMGNLLLDIFVTNQDLIPNGIGNSYTDADSSGSVTSRAYALNGSNSGVADGFGLVTTFGTSPTTATPEPASLTLLGGGLAGLALLRHRRSRS